jgi:hypothetical protein
MYTLFVTVYLVIPLPETPSSHTVYINIYIYIYIILANSTHYLITDVYTV